MGQIRRIVTANGLSAVVSIHDLNLALRFADRFLFLKDHRVFAAAGREQVTAEVIEAVYGIPVDIHDIGGRRIVIPR
jgi:iron complex transport system ATP-binding protein